MTTNQLASQATISPSRTQSDLERFVADEQRRDRVKQVRQKIDALGIKQVYFWRPSRPNENVAVAPATPFPRATLAKRVSTRERCGRGVQQSYSAAALNLL